MKCVIPGANIKVFGRAIHSLSRVGEELYIEPMEHGLALRTVNSSRSAYACFVFSPCFFLDYSDGRAYDSSSDSEDEVLKYKLNMKSCFAMFRSLSTLEKTVDKCKIKLDEKEARLVFQMYCRHGIVKTHNLAFIECESLQAVFSKDLTPNVLTAQTKLLCEAVMNFQTTQEEVSLIVDPLKTRLKNYVEDESDPHKVIHTELSLEPEEFESYQVGVDSEVTFCLKELRAILAFSEPANLPISIHFESSGKPIVFSMNTDPSFEATFVLATLAERNSQANCSQQTVQPHRMSQQLARHNTSSSQKTRRQEKKAERLRHEDEDEEPRTLGVNHQLRPECDDSLKRLKRPPHRHKKSASARLEAACEDLTKDDMTLDLPGEPAGELRPLQLDSANRLPSDTNGFDDSTLQPEVPRPSLSCVVKEDEEEDDMPCSPIIPVHQSFQHSRTQGPESKLTSRLPVSDDSTTEDEAECVPGTPPSKKFKSIFAGFSQSTTRSTQESTTVLAADTDDED